MTTTYLKCLKLNQFVFVLKTDKQHIISTYCIECNNISIFLICIIFVVVFMLYSLKILSYIYKSVKKCKLFIEHPFLTTNSNKYMIMIKKITFLLILLALSFGYSQQVVVQDFQSETLGGAIPGDGLFGAPTSGTIVADPEVGGTRGLVAELIASNSGNVWQGTNVELNLSVDLTQALPADRIMEIDVYSLSPISMLVRVIGTTNNEASAAVTHTGSGWETLTATFDTMLDGKPVANGVYTAFVVYPNWDTNTNNFISPAISRTVYFDNIKGIGDTCSNGVQDGTETGVDCGGSCAPCPAPPSTAAPTPPARDPGNVISIYSDAYTNVPIDDFDFGLCGGVPDVAVTEVMIAGNPTQNYTGAAGCQGISVETNRIDASTFTNLHVDFYTDDAIIGAVFNLKLVDWNGNTTEATATGLELNFNGGTNPALVEGQWVSLDFDLTAIDAPVVIGDLTRSDIAQIHITSNLPSAWYDNLYLYKTPFIPGTCSDGIMNQDETGIDCGGTISGCAPCSGVPTVAAPTPPARAASDVISIYSDAYTDVAIDAFDFGLCGGVPNIAVTEVMIAGNPTQNYTGAAGCQGISVETNRLDASTFTNLHVDFYTDDAIIGAVFNLKLVDWNGNTTEATATGLELNFNGGTTPALVANQWVSLDFDLTAINAPTVIGNLTRSDIAQIHITSNIPNAWYDNLYLYKGTPLSTNDISRNSFRTYPNPTQDNWTIETQNVRMSLITVFDVLGKTVMYIEPKSETVVIDGSNLKSGLYFAKVETEAGTSSVKLVKK